MSSVTITDEMNRAFCEATCNPQPLHTDEAFAAVQGHRACVVNSGLTLAIACTLAGVYPHEGFKRIEFGSFVYVGDTIEADVQSNVLDARIVDGPLVMRAYLP